MSDKPLFGMLPPQATKIAVEHDLLFIFLFYLSLFFLVLVMGVMVWFVIKYRDGKNTKVGNINHHAPLEIAWTLIPTVILAVVFAWGFVVYKDMTVTPGNAYEIHVNAKQWLFEFQYNEGKSTINELYVPAGRPVVLNMTSSDVLHAFFVPDFRIKKDIVPGAFSKVWFKVEKPGEHVIYCAEYCGTTHSGMIGKVIALSPTDFEEWRSKKDGALDENLSLAQQGEIVFKRKACAGCHSVDGSQLVGPSFKGLWSKTEKFADGSSVAVDEAYIRESIIEPNAKVVAGFQAGQMPTYKGNITDAEINAVIAYIQSLK